MNYIIIKELDLPKNFNEAVKGDETSYLSLEEEQTLMEGLRSKALSGHILTAKDLLFEIEEKLNKKVSDDYVWDLLKRHNWKKKVPRPIHPKTIRNLKMN